MLINKGLKRKQQQIQRTILQNSGKEKEFRKLQKKAKKELNAERIYLYQDVEPWSIGEMVYIILVVNKEDDILAKVVGFTVDEVMEALEGFINE